MKRLVYNPRVNVYVKSDTGVVDISPFVTSCTVNRKVDQVSHTSVTFRNPQIRSKDFGTRFMFTEHLAPDGTLQPLFHPQDPIIVTMTRLRDKPIQVFTGYCDTTPYIQLFPGICTLEASCTLKRLQYTFWDPGLPFVWQFLASYGWGISQDIGGIMNAAAESDQLDKVNKLNDSSIGNLLFAVLKYVGGWDESTIYIEPLPDTIGDTVAQLFEQFADDNKAARDEFTSLLHEMIGTGSYGAGGGSGAGSSGDLSSGPIKGEKQVIETILKVAKEKGVDPVFAATVAFIETRWTGVDQPGGKYLGWYQWDSANGPPGSYTTVGIKDSKPDGAHDLGFSCGLFCEAANRWAKKNPELKEEKNWWAWASHIQGVTQGWNTLTNPALNGNALYQAQSFNKFKAEVKSRIGKYANGNG